MRSTSPTLFVPFAAALALAGCPSSSDPPPVDAGGGVADAPPTADTGPSDTDAGPPETDAGPGPDDAGGPIDGGGTATDAPALCSGGAECAGFPSLERGCTLGAGGADVNCAPELHQVDCCGTMHVIGINHGVVDAYCAAEALCRASYPAAACGPGEYVLDTGETTTDLDLVHVRCNIPSGAAVGTCETYLGAAGGGAGGCGG